MHGCPGCIVPRILRASRLVSAKHHYISCFTMLASVRQRAFASHCIRLGEKMTGSGACLHASLVHALSG